MNASGSATSSTLPETGPIDWVLSTTRAVRKRLDFDRPVPKEVLVEALRLAIQAPTTSNAQSWRWIVVEDQAKKDAIAELYRRSWAAYAGDRDPDKIPGQLGKVVGSGQYLAENLQRAPYLVIAATTTEAPLGSLPSAGLAGLYGGILPAAWSFQLALRSRGLGSAWTTLHLVYEAEVRALLGIPENVVQTALFPVAYTIGEDFKPAKRTTPLEAVTHWDSWGNTLA